MTPLAHSHTKMYGGAGRCGTGQVVTPVGVDATVVTGCEPSTGHFWLGLIVIISGEVDVPQQRGSRPRRRARDCERLEYQSRRGAPAG
jgi:hypothetical protein